MFCQLRLFASFPLRCLASAVAAAILLGGTMLSAQDTKAETKPEAKQAAADPAPAAPLHVVAAEPTSIDSATLVDAKLRQAATIVFEDAALSEVAGWVQKQTGYNVALDLRSLDSIGIDANSPISDKLQDSPIYLLLDRLRRLGIEWRLNGGVLQLYGHDDDLVLHNVQYNVGDLLDQKYPPAAIQDVLQACIGASAGWSDDGGKGDLVLLGDVLFIRQDSRTHRRIAGLLAALRSPARRVLVDDPVAHKPLRTALDRPTTVAFKAKPLAAAIDEMAKTAAIDMRLDRVALRKLKVTERTPVTFELRDQSLRTTLDLMLGQLQLSWILRDGVLWVTAAEEANEFLKTAVYDVRDLCPDDESSVALSDAIQRQADARSWVDDGGDGTLEFAKPGVMVVMQTERGLDSIQVLLENYRIALRNSKRRVSPDEDPEVVELKYYRMPTVVAEDLEELLPSILQPESWKSEKHPTAIGTIRRLRSWNQPRPSGDTRGRAPDSDDSTSYSILLIEQKRKVHREIPKILQRIEHGDAIPAGGMGGMGGGMGGFF